MARANTCFQVLIQTPVQQVTSTRIKSFKEAFHGLFRKRTKKRPKGDQHAWRPKSRFHGQLCMGICVILAWPPLHGIEALCMATLHQVGVLNQEKFKGAFFFGGLIQQVKV